MFKIRMRFIGQESWLITGKFYDLAIRRSTVTITAAPEHSVPVPYESLESFFKNWAIN